MSQRPDAQTTDKRRPAAPFAPGTYAPAALAVLAARLPAGAKLVHIYLANVARPPNWLAWPAVATLARATRQDRRTVLRHLARLEADGWIEPRGRTSRGTLIYALTTAADAPPQTARKTVTGDTFARRARKSVTPRRAKLSPDTPLSTLIDTSPADVHADAETGPGQAPLGFALFWELFPGAAAANAYQRQSALDRWEAEALEGQRYRVLMWLLAAVAHPDGDDWPTPTAWLRARPWQFGDEPLYLAEATKAQLALVLAFSLDAPAGSRSRYLAAADLDPEPQTTPLLRRYRAACLWDARMRQTQAKETPDEPDEQVESAARSGDETAN